ncbi:MAG: radical SAM protein [Alphaproteobacteria bacterium]|nr:radical SAM protein [Alphaproteobacteria bacterium]
MQAEGLPGGLTEARRALAHLISEGHEDLHTRRPLKRALREALEAHATWARPEVLERVEDPDDGSLRYLFRFADGAMAEAVRIPLEAEGRFTVCLSSQVGCAMACDFCATGRLGFSRNLDPHEIVGQLLVARAEAPGRITGAVFMGQGEPFHNYDKVIQAARVLSDPNGGRIAQKSITISTVGLVPQLRRYTAEGHRYKLIVSLSSAMADKRRRLLPVAGRWPLEALFDALREHHAATGQRATLAWVLLGGVNDGPEEVEALRALVGELPVTLNLIDVNDARPDGYRRSTDAERDALLDALQVLRAPIVRRFSVGRGSRSACGMLASTRQEAV